MKCNSTRPAGRGVRRREFLRHGAVGTGLAWLVSAAGGGCRKATPGAAPAVLRGAVEEVRTAIVGYGVQGRTLVDDGLGIPGVRFAAACDIWPYALRYAQGHLRVFGHEVSAHADFDEMLAAASDRGVRAVIIATPDAWHSPYTVRALRAGFHVYCEKMMSNTVEGARAMVRAMRASGRLLQIGHQRRSNPEYRYARERILADPDVLGRIVNASAQWNRSVAGSREIGYGEKYALPRATLERYGYADMREFRNWRWFRRHGGGPVSDLGAHQIDIFSWFLGSRPATVVASGGADYFTGREWYDNVMAIYEYRRPEGGVRAFYETLTTTSAGGGYFESFMGVNGTLRMSEMPGGTCLYREPHVAEQTWAGRRWVNERAEETLFPADIATMALLDVRASRNQYANDFPVRLTKMAHQPHLENFFNAIRGTEALNCPADEAFASEAAVFKVNESIAADRKLVFSAADFEA